MMLSLQLNANSWEGRVAEALHPSRGKKVVLPSYVGASHVTATSVQLPKEVYSDTNKALMNSFASITAFNVQNVSIDDSVMISCY